MKALDAIRIVLKFSDMGMTHLSGMKDAPLLRPGPWGGNHAMWIAGHLTVVEGRLHKILQGTPNPVERWKPLFDWRPNPKPTKRPIRRLKKCCKPFDDCAKEPSHFWRRSVRRGW